LKDIDRLLIQALLGLQGFHVLFLLLHDWLPLGTLNDLKALRAADPNAKIVRTTLIQTLPYAVGLAGSLFWYGHPYPMWLVWWLWISYGLLFVGELQAWWIPYLLIRQPKRAERYKAMFGNTLTFLPEHNGIRPNALHVILHAATLALLVVLAITVDPAML
jgi:hypothetical protein